MSPLSIAWADVEPIANHLWQSTLVLAVCAGLAAMLRRNRAHVRHWLWLVASLKFAVPFALLAQVGRLLPPVGSLTPAFSVPPVAGAVVQPFSQVILPLADPAAAETAARATLVSVIPAALVVIWVAGMLAICATWLVRWRRVRAIAAAAAPIAEGREPAMLRALEVRAGRRRALPLLLTNAALEPGVFGVRRPVLLWPRGISERLDDGQIEAVLAHELSHVHRHDNLKSALHMVVQAVFWFHPLVWWLGARLMDERERACDETVLLWGRDPETYAEGILKTCEFSIESPLACVAGVTGADLRRRIEQIMESRAVGFLSMKSKLLLALVACLAVIVPVVAGSMQPGGRDVGRDLRPGKPLATPAPIAQSLHEYSLIRSVHQVMSHMHGYVIDRLILGVSGGKAAPSAAPSAAQDPTTATFEVASIKPNKSGDGPMQIGTQLTRFTTVNVPLRQLIVLAYGVQAFQIDGGPSWLTTERFDITAKIPDRFANAPTPPGQLGPVAYMMQALLADRFKLKVEPATKEASIYELQRARGDGKLGPGLTLSTVDCAAMFAQARAGGAPPPSPSPGGAPACGMMMGPGNIAGGSSPIAQLARALSNRVGRPVIDKTGLTGNYDFTITFAPEFGGGGPLGGGPPTPPPGAPPLPPIDSNAPNVFTALQEQLGLKLEAKRGPVETLVIKSAQMPAED